MEYEWRSCCNIPVSNLVLILEVDEELVLAGHGPEESASIGSRDFLRGLQLYWSLVYVAGRCVHYFHKRGHESVHLTVLVAVI